MLGYFRETKKGQVSFSLQPFRVREVLDSGVIAAKRGVHSWLIVFLDSLLSQRMTE
jgi:hypothetical protein